MTLATTLAAPVEEGMMLPDAQRPPRQSLFEDASTTFCVAVMAWTVVMRPSSMPNLSLMALTMGARPLVVHDAHETAFIDGSWVSSLTPMTTVGESSLAGAEKMIFLAPAAMWGATLSLVRKAPVDSQMYSAPMAPKGISEGSRVCVVGVRTPSIMRPSAVGSMVPG